MSKAGRASPTPSSTNERGSLDAPPASHLGFWTWAAAAWADAPFGISYSGRLVDQSGKPLDGPRELVITFHDAVTAGNQIGPTIPLHAVSRVDGTFQHDYLRSPFRRQWDDSCARSNLGDLHDREHSHRVTEFDSLETDRCPLQYFRRFPGRLFADDGT